MPYGSKATISTRQFIFTMLVVVIASAFIFISLGALLFSQQSPQPGGDLDAFVTGLVEGTKIRTEFQDWQSEGSKALDFRGMPRTRCAALYFPNNPTAMEGCLQGLEDRPATGYKFPTR